MFSIQGQGVLSERLRSFSMQDLSSFQAEGQAKNASSVTTQPAACATQTTHHDAQQIRDWLQTG